MLRRTIQHDSMKRIDKDGRVRVKGRRWWREWTAATRVWNFNAVFLIPLKKKMGARIKMAVVITMGRLLGFFCLFIYYQFMIQVEKWSFWVWVIQTLNSFVDWYPKKESWTKESGWRWSTLIFFSMVYLWCLLTFLPLASFLLLPNSFPFIHSLPCIHHGNLLRKTCQARSCIFNQYFWWAFSFRSCLLLFNRCFFRKLFAINGSLCLSWFSLRTISLR